MRRRHMARDGPVAIWQVGVVGFVVLLSVFLAAISGEGSPAPRIDVSLGFSGYFVPERMVPLRVRISGVDEAFAGSLQITEQVGNAWRGQARASFCIPIDSALGIHEDAIPIYDFSHPLVVSLLDEQRNIIAQQEVNLRDKWKSKPFTLLAGSFDSAFQAVGDAVQISEIELPSKWVSYGGVSSLWLGRMSYGLSAAQEEAIYRWTSAGGTTVIFTGSDFFRIDSPLMRGMIPLASPHMAAGERRLSGDLRSGAKVVMGDPVGAPLVIWRRLGAGDVLLVTVDAFSLSQAQYTDLRGVVTDAELLNLNDVARSLLLQMPLTRPGFPTAIAIVAVLLLSLVMIASRVRRGPARGVMLLIVVLACSVWSGLYANQTKQLCNIYTVNTGVSAQMALGYTILSRGYIYLGGRDLAAPLVRVNDAILQELPHDLNDTSYDIDISCDDGATISMQPEHMRVLRGGSRDAARISLFRSGDERVEIDSRLDVALPYAAVINDGESFVVGPISPGAHEYSLSGATGALAPTPRGLAMLYNAVSKAYDLSLGTWLIAGGVSDSIVDDGNYRQKVRDVKLVLVEGESR